MKKVAAHLLILLLLLNVMGYYGVFIGLKYSHNVRLNAQLDNLQYDHSETVTLKVPITIPYYGNTNFERVTGEIEHEGEFYKLVKQKYESDTLYIVCIKDEHSQRIKQALSDYVKNFSEHSADGMLKTAPSFIKDFVSPTFCFSSASQGWQLNIQFGLTEQRVKEVVRVSISPPPEA